MELDYTKLSKSAQQYINTLVHRSIKTGMYKRDLNALIKKGWAIRVDVNEYCITPAGRAAYESAHKAAEDVAVETIETPDNQDSDMEGWDENDGYGDVYLDGVKVGTTKDIPGFHPAPVETIETPAPEPRWDYRGNLIARNAAAIIKAVDGVEPSIGIQGPPIATPPFKVGEKLVNFRHIYRSLLTGVGDDYTNVIRASTVCTVVEVDELEFTKYPIRVAFMNEDGNQQRVWVSPNWFIRQTPQRETGTEIIYVNESEHPRAFIRLDTFKSGGELTTHINVHNVPIEELDMLISKLEALKS